MIVDSVNTAYIKLGFEPGSSGGECYFVEKHMGRFCDCAAILKTRGSTLYSRPETFFFLLVQSPHELCNPSSLLSSVYGGMGGAIFSVTRRSERAAVLSSPSKTELERDYRCPTRHYWHIA